MPNNDKKEQLEELKRNIQGSAKTSQMFEYIMQASKNGTLSIGHIKGILMDGISMHIEKQ